MTIYFQFLAHSQPEPPPCLILLARDCDSCVNENLDLSTDCTTCRSMAGPIECTPAGNSDCGVSVILHGSSLHNPLHTHHCNHHVLLQCDTHLQALAASHFLLSFTPTPTLLPCVGSVEKMVKQFHAVHFLLMDVCSVP